MRISITIEPDHSMRLRAFVSALLFDKEITQAVQVILSDFWQRSWRSMKQGSGRIFSWLRFVPEFTKNEPDTGRGLLLTTARNENEDRVV